MGPAGLPGATGATGAPGATGATGPAGFGGGEGWVYGASTASAQRTAWYSGLNGESSHPADGDDERQYTGTTVPYSCTLHKMQVAARYVGGSGTADLSVTVHRNGAATAMSCTVTVSNQSTTYSCMSTEPVSFEPGDLVGLGYTMSNPGPSLRIGVGSSCEQQ